MNTSTSILNRLVTQYQNENDKESIELMVAQRFCFPSIFMDLGVKLTSEQILDMLEVLTQEQLDTIATKLDNNVSWY